MAKHAGTVYRGWLGFAIATAGAGLLCSCGVMWPIDEPSPGRMFVPSPTSQAAEDASCKGSDAFAAGLGAEICSADSLRLRWMKDSATVTNNTVNFNALLWPLGSVALYYHLKKSDGSLLLPAAVATGIYGFLNAGVPGRDAINRQAAKELACAIIDASGNLYSEDEYKGVTEALDDLDTKIENFEGAQGELLDGLKVQGSGGGASNPDSIEQLVGRPSRGGNADPLPALWRYVSDRLQLARKIKANGQSLKSEISASAMRLRAQRADVEWRRRADLAKNSPDLRNPAEEQTRIADFIKGVQVGVATAQSGPSTERGKDDKRKDEAKADPSTATVPPSLLKSLKPTSRQEWRKFEKGVNHGLQRAFGKVQASLIEDALRKEWTKKTREQLGCNPLESAPVTREDATGRRKSALSGSSEPASGTSLPILGSPQ